MTVSEDVRCRDHPSVDAAAELLVTRGRGTHFVAGPYCQSCFEHMLAMYPHTLPGTGEVLHATRLEIGA